MALSNRFPAEVGETGLLLQRARVRADHIFVQDFRARDGLCDCAAHHAERVPVQFARCHQFRHHGRKAASAEIGFAEVCARRHHVHEQRNVVADAVPIVVVQLDADVAGDGVHVRRAVGGCSDGGRTHNRVFEGLARHDPRRAQILVDERNRAQARRVGHLPAFAVRGGDRSAAGKRHAQRFGQRVHGTRRAHRVAVADAGRGRQDKIHEAVIVDFARRIAPPRFPFDGSGASELAFEMAVEHRAAREDDGGQIDGRGGHEERGRCLVAASQQHDAVERIAVKDLNNAKIGEVAMQRRRGPYPRFLQRMHGKLERDAARVADAVAHAARELNVMAIAGHKIAARLRDADDGAAALQLLAGQPVIQEALEILRRHARIIGIVPPRAASEPLCISCRHRRTFLLPSRPTARWRYR